ncbi:MAG: F0F1 ATP synthase subunit B [Kiritimatiellaeota bacterium]|nr:F0F1 ATP synthase subunit B [Kiritimatiellota bacterium]
MAENASTQATLEVPAHGGAEAHPPGLVDIAPGMLIWVWVTFLLFMVILTKVAWKPILAALDKREETLRQSLDNATRLREELAQLDQKRQAILAEADHKAREIMGTAHQAAGELADSIENKARGAARDLVESARREIADATQQARATLRRESAELAIAAASKLLQENLDDAKHRALTEQLIRKLDV